MNAPFPFGFPGATAFYLTLYVVTLLIHVAFMNYVLAGATCLVFGLGRGRAGSAGNALAHILQDWLPFCLGLAITAGVAPLLFLQILYQESFYTSNLLLSHRWMAILPVLIVGFYLLYLQKTAWLMARGTTVVLLVRTVAWLCFTFIAWSWTENHLLSLDREGWVTHYASGHWLYYSPELPPRLAVWYFGALPTLALVLGWQTRWIRGESQIDGDETVRLLTGLGLAGLALTTISGVWYATTLPGDVRGKLLGGLAGPYLGLAAAGLVIQAAAWWLVWRRQSLSRGLLWFLTAGWLCGLVGGTVVRECRRLVALDLSPLEKLHAEAAQVGGLVAFLVFFAINAGLITYSVILVRRLPSDSGDAT